VYINKNIDTNDHYRATKTYIVILLFNQYFQYVETHTEL